MYSTILLGLLGAAVACPTAPPKQPDAQGVQFRVTLTDSSKDPNGIQDTYVVNHHVGAGQNILAVGGTQGDSPVFFRNGTVEEATQGKVKLVSLNGQFQPYHLDFAKSEQDGFDFITLGATTGNSAIVQTQQPDGGFPRLGPTGEYYAVCPTVLPGETKSTPVLYHTKNNKADPNCQFVLVELTCATLQDLPAHLPYNPYGHVLPSKCTNPQPRK